MKVLQHLFIRFNATFKTKSPFAVHGLNQNPRSFHQYLKDLARHGIRSYLLHLPGHRAEKSISSNLAEDVLRSYDQAYQWILDKEGRLDFFIGYSFGGLIGTYQLPYKPIEKLLLIAPALSLRPYTLAIQPILPFVSKVYSIPLGGKKDDFYRFHQNGVPVEVYRSFFEIYRNNKVANLPSNSQALVFAHPKDELVSYRGLKKWTEHFSNWELKTLDNRAASFKKFNHLCLDEQTLGLDSYQSLVDQSLAFLVK